MELQTLNTHFLEHKALIQKLLREGEIALNFYEQFNQSQVRLGAIMATFKQHQNDHAALKYWIETLKLEETKADYLKTALDNALSNVNSIIQAQTQTQTQGQAPPQYVASQTVFQSIDTLQSPTPVYQQAPIDAPQSRAPIYEPPVATHTLALADENLALSSNNAQNTEGVAAERTDVITEKEVIVEEVINQKITKVYYAYEPVVGSKAFENNNLPTEPDGMTVYKLSIYEDGKNGLFTIIEEELVYEDAISRYNVALTEACDFINSPQSATHTRIETEKAGKIKLNETGKNWTIIQKATIKFL